MTTGKPPLAESRQAKTNTDVLPSFVLWAIDQLGLQAAQSDGVYRLEVPDVSPDGAAGDLGAVQPTSFAFERAALGDASNDVELVTANSPLFQSLVGALQASGAVVHARPASQPQSVHEIAERLFSAYTIDGGRIHLGGCTLTDQPFLRVTVRTPDEQPTAGGLLRHLLLDARGDIVNEATIEQLGLDNIVPLVENQPKLPEEQLARLLASVDRMESLPEGTQRLVATVVWCKWAEGKLTLTIGESVAEQPFSGWAQTLEAPPFACPHTGAESFHVAATDDGRITAADEIEACAESARRVLRSDLIECSATGVRVLPEFTETCPVTAKPVLRSTLAPCPVCRQLVSSAARSGAGCLACQAMDPVTKDDPRIARILGEHPGLDRWQHWKLSETTTAYVASATKLIKRLLVVVDKQTLGPVYLAEGNRFLAGWTPITESQSDEFLR